MRTVCGWGRGRGRGREWRWAVTMMTMTMPMPTTITMRIWPRCCGGWPSAPGLHYSSTALSLSLSHSSSVCLFLFLAASWLGNKPLAWKRKKGASASATTSAADQQQQNRTGTTTRYIFVDFAPFGPRHCALAIKHSGQIRLHSVHILFTKVDTKGSI